MTGRLQGKIALIAGSGAGIGRTSALRFALEGAAVVVADLDADAASIVAKDIERAGGRALAQGLDIADQASVDSVVSTAVKTYGRIDVLFNCAGGGSPRDGAVTDLNIDEFWRTIRVDLFGTLLICRRVIPEMQRHGGGSIINMSSLRAILGTLGADAYTASKGGVLSLSRAMAVKWADHNIRVNVLVPGVVLTERVVAFVKPENPIYQKSLLGPSDPIDVANLALFLASDESKKITGTVMRVDGGASVH